MQVLRSALSPSTLSEDASESMRHEPRTYAERHSSDDRAYDIAILLNISFDGTMGF